MMNKILGLILIFNLMAFADFSNFKNIDKDSIKPFTEDLGGLMGSSVSNTARSLGFSGFDISLKSAYQIKPSLKNKVMDKEKAFGIDFLQIEIGLPYRIDSFIRTGLGEKLFLVGWGLKYGLWKITDELYKFNGNIIVDSNMALNENFYAIQYGSQLVFSFNCGWIRPFLSFGFDNTMLNIQNANDTSLIDKSYYTLKERFTTGLKFKYKWVNLSLAYNNLHGENGAEGAFGIRF